MRCLIEPTIEPAQVHPALAEYTAAIAEHCPYLGPSTDRELTTWYGYEAEPADAPHVLGLLADSAEDLRLRRHTAGPLVCHNIAIFGPHDIATARAVLDWPAWIIRNLYAPVKVMVGRFRIGEHRIDRLGRTIAPPPVSFLSIRHAFPDRDARFLADFPDVAAKLATSNDDGRDVLLPVLGIPTSPQAIADAYEQLVALFPAPPAKDRKAPVA